MTASLPPVHLISPTIDDDATWFSRTPDASHPIVLLLHGYGSHEMDLPGLVPHLPPQFTYVALRGIYAAQQGYAWFDLGVLGGGEPDPTLLDVSAQAVETWIEAQDVPVVGALGFSQGGALTLQVLRRNASALRFGAVMSGFPFPAPVEGDGPTDAGAQAGSVASSSAPTTTPRGGDAALAAVKPPVLWSHGGQDPIVVPQWAPQVREFLHEHTELTEVFRPMMGHAIDQVILQELSRFLQLQHDALDG